MFLIVSRFEMSNNKKIRFFETAKVDDPLKVLSFSREVSDAVLRKNFFPTGETRKLAIVLEDIGSNSLNSIQ